MAPIHMNNAKDTHINRLKKLDRDAFSFSAHVENTSVSSTKSFKSCACCYMKRNDEKNEKNFAYFPFTMENKNDTFVIIMTIRLDSY